MNIDIDVNITLPNGEKIKLTYDELKQLYDFLNKMFSTTYPYKLTWGSTDNPNGLTYTYRLDNS